MLNLLKHIIKRWRKKYVPNNELQNHWDELIISLVEEYVSNLSTTCDFPELPDEALEPQSVSSFKQQLKEVFMVPRLNSFHEIQNQINKSHLVEAFLSFLLRLLHHVTDSIDSPVKGRIDILEKELRYLLTILGDISWMLCDNDDEFRNLLAEFEAMANQAGSVVHSLLFSTARSFQKMDEGLAAVFKHIHLLKTNLQSSTSISACTAPRTSIVDSILILDSLVDDLKDLLKQKDDRIADVKDQIRLLHKRLMHLHSSINEMRSPQPSEVEELKEPLMRIGDVAYQAEYLITSFLVKDAPHWYVIRRLTELNQKVKLIRKELKTVTQKYQFGGLKVAEYFSAELPLHDKRNTEANEVTVGFEEKTNDILYELVGGGTKSLQVISILGMAGLGKTTLAKKLYNHTSVSYRFDKLAWCVVSQSYKMCDILSDILTLIESKFGKEENLVEHIEHIHKTLKGRRYLIVLDDIWDSDALYKLLRCFPDDENGSRILLTSRNKDVAPPSSKIHELPFLSNEQCWELLEKKVFGAPTCPPELQEIGKKIAAKCCGLPLSVVVIAGVLSTVGKIQSTWEEVRRSLASYLDGEDNSVKQTLELSYKHLPDHLKPCFLYFGAFEEDKEISVGNLKRLWVAEGFIRIENKKSRENVAEEYLMELIDRSLVMVAKRRIDGRGVKSCVVHDLLRDMCLKKSKEESFLEYLKNDNYIICEKGHRLRALGDAATLSHCQHVRSFYGDRQISSLYVRDMRLLRVLHFSYIQKYHIFGIEYLVNLRFLVIKNLPTWIDRLLNLEYLCVESLETVYLPPSIVKMVKLRYLHALFAEYGEDWSSYQTNNLEFLSGVTIKKLKDECLLKCSRRLRRLKCRYDTRGITDKKSYPCFDLRFLTQLDSLSLKFYHHRRLNLRKFGFPSNIRKLTLSESRLRWERMSIIGRLQNLEILKLSRNAFEGERWVTRDGEFQKLRFLQLDKISLSQWNVVSNEHFPKLQQLILIACLNLQEVPSEIGDITTLQLIEVKGHCLDTLVESAERIKQEQQDMDNEDLRVIISTTDK